MPSKNSHPGHRDSETGQFVKEKYAEKHPKTTQRSQSPTPEKVIRAEGVVNAARNLISKNGKCPGIIHGHFLM